MELTSRSSPKLMARMVAVSYVVLLLAGFDTFYVLPKLVVRTDSAVTAANIQAHEGLFLAGFSSALIGVASYLVVTALLYRLFEPVSRTLSLVAACFSLTGCVIQGMALIFHYAPMLLLGDQPYLSAMPPEQRQALALFSVRAYAQAYNISLPFFAFYLLQLAYLIRHSTFLPRWLAPLVALGAGWLAFAYPPLAQALWPWIALASVGEMLLVLWLGVRGVDEERWHEQAAAAGVR